jgi:hypothetical protein
MITLVKISLNRETMPFPFKGKVGMGMGLAFEHTHPHPNPPLEGRESFQYCTVTEF